MKSAVKYKLRTFTEILCVVIFSLSSGCATVKGYEKMYLSDDEMQLKEPPIQQFESDVETYREGASGGNIGQTGGGCGCN